MMTPYDKTKSYSESKIDTIKRSIAPLIPGGDIVLTCGSYARREASDESDMDFFIISKSNTSVKSHSSNSPQLLWINNVFSEISKAVKIEPSSDGPFAKVENYASMLKNIGGENDTNPKITRRMLFLLEGEALFNRVGLENFRREVLERYISDKITDHQLALFLLNDIIRYYRTIATDYEFKTTEIAKPWGIRNIKLVFSRKLLYASGLFSVAQTADRMRDRKITILEHLFNMPVIDRMIEICGRNNFTEVLRSYNYFLERIELPEVRDRLKNLKPENRNDPVFRELKNEGHHFTRELMRLFENTFDSTHPIRRAVIF